MAAGQRGRWIAFEGGEGSGKSTQAARLAERLDAALTREPGGTLVGERIRAILLDPSVVSLDDRAETLLMAADRAQHVAEVVAPTLEAGRDVVSDRSAWSSLAYQGVARGLGVDRVRSVCSWATGGLWPDLAILLDVADEVASARLTGPPDRLEAQGAAFHDKVRGGFRSLAAAEPDRWVVVDGAGSIDEVAARVDAAFDEWVGRRRGIVGTDV